MHTCVSCFEIGKMQIFFHLTNGLCAFIFIQERDKSTKAKFQRVEVPYTLGAFPEVLASGKLVWGDPSSEGSQTAKVCTDEQVELENIAQCC